jgi:hypothetical protein
MSKTHQRAIQLLAEKTKLGLWHRRWVYFALAAVWGSGALWVFAHYGLVANNEFGATRHPIEAWALKLHGAAAFLFLIALGSMFAQHIPRAWFLKRNIASGIATLTVCALLVVSGYWLYYFAEDESRSFVSTLHWAVGLGAIGLFWLHLWLGRRAAR